ncbi:glycosyltransferase [Candidatus Microgenomates bacterium]|nr:glycosyltransferase [Candidatus Microgenomates bacterium]
MLKAVRVGKKDFYAYGEIIGHPLYHEIRDLAKHFKGVRILHINTTARGGGVAQILHSLVPLAKDLGIDMHWKVVQAEADFFVISKKLHNSLQGSSDSLSQRDWQYYEKQNQQFALAFDVLKWDYIFVHDPQPAAMAGYCNQTQAKDGEKRQGPRWIWRCHLDLSKPNPDVKRRFVRYLEGYDGAIYSLKPYILSRSPVKEVAIVPVAIDPVSAKNKLLKREEALSLVAGYGVDITRPLMVQISRFDPWKDPLGVLKAWELAKKEVPGLQLVLMGDSAHDDPEGKSVLDRVLEKVKGKSDVFVITDSNELAVNAFQTCANVVLQKSIREGFGLTVSEALWAGTPVIGAKVGGIVKQIKDGKNGYLVTNITQAARKAVHLIENPLKARRMGQWGHEYVREHFLLPRLLRDELKFLLKL